MLDYNLLKTKTLCLQIYFFITEISETARNAIADIENGEVNSSTILAICNETLDFANKIINQLSNYTKDVDSYVSDINNREKGETKEVVVKKEHNGKKNKLSLKKEQNEEYTQDEFLEIYKIDMTEDFGTVTFKDDLEKDNGTSSDTNSKESLLQSDNSEPNGSLKNKDDVNCTLNLLEDVLSSPETLNEDDILKKIGYDTSDTESESQTIFSGSTLILGENTDVANDLEELDELSNSDDNEEVNKNDNVDQENNLVVKQCSVVLTNCEIEKLDHQIKENIIDKEQRQIENLLNLDNLKRKHSADSSKPNKRKKRSKGGIDKKDNDLSTEDLSDNSESECEDKENQQDNNCIVDKNVTKDQTDMLNVLLNCISDASDPLEITSDPDNTASDTNSEKKKKKVTNKKATEEDAVENQKRDETETECEVIINGIQDNESRKKKKWRQDKLLIEKLTSGSSDDEKENNPEERRRPKRRKRVCRKSLPDGAMSKILGSSESDKQSDSDFDIEEIRSDNTYLSSDSTSSDVEFVKTFNEESTEKKDEPAKVGRRNIRSVKSDALLDATTKKAQREEEERLDRLEPRTQVLSQLAEEPKLVLDFDKETKVPLITVDESITQRLKRHQKEGVRFMWNSCYESVEALKTSQGTGCVLAHCMGLGKTFQVIALVDTLFAHAATNTKHVLIVCPLSTVLNWEDEFRIYFNISKHKRKIKRFLITDGKSKDERLRMVMNWYKNSGVLILGYDSFQSLLNKCVPKKVVEALLDPGPDLVVCDEGHLIKNGTRNRAKTLTKIKSKRRIILTGTPMQNNLTEYYYMVDFVKPNLLGTKKEFSNRFINPIVNGSYDDSTETDIKIMRQRSHVLHEYLKHTVQRYEMTELLEYLPDKLDYVLFVQLHDFQIELYKSYLEVVFSTGFDKKNRSFFADYMRLRDVWTHPCILRIKEQAKQNKRKEVDTIVIEPEVQEEIPNEWQSKYPDDLHTNIEYGPKMNVMLEIIEHSVRLEDKVLVFGAHLAELDAIENFINPNGWRKNVNYLRMDGTVPPDTRMAFCKKFNRKDSSIKLFLLSHQIGGLGLNLIAANRIILMDVNFNPALDTQSIFRTYRFGQDKRCYVYRLVSMGTMEEVVYERSVTKQAVSLRVVDEHQISRHYKSNDLHKMYRFNLYTDDQRPVLKLPADEVLATILEKRKKEIFKYHEHKDLLENRPEEQLNAEEQKLAWDEFRREQENAYQNAVTATIQMQNIQNNPLVNQAIPSTSQITPSAPQPSTSSLPPQEQHAINPAAVKAQTTSYAAIRLQQFANLSNMKQQHNNIDGLDVFRMQNAVSASQPSAVDRTLASILRQAIPNAVQQNFNNRYQTLMRAQMANFRQQTPNIRQQTPNIGQQTPNIRQQAPNIKQQTPNIRQQTPNIRQQMPNPRQQTPNIRAQMPNFRQQTPNTSVSNTRQQIVSAISHLNTANISETSGTPSSNSAPSDIPTLIYVDMPIQKSDRQNLLPVNAAPINVPSTSMSIPSTSSGIIHLNERSVNKNPNENNNKQFTTARQNIMNTQRNDIGWLNATRQPPDYTSFIASLQKNTAHPNAITDKNWPKASLKNTTSVNLSHKSGESYIVIELD